MTTDTVQSAPGEQSVTEETQTKTARENRDRFVVAVGVTMRPELGPEPDPSTAAATQVWAPSGDAAAQRTAAILRSQDVRGLFFLDVMAGLALGAQPFRSLARDLIGAGHDIGLMVNLDPWVWLLRDERRLAAPDLLAMARRSFREWTGFDPRLIMLSGSMLNLRLLSACRDAGLHTVIASPHDFGKLPAWMQARTTPFQPLEGVVIVPTAQAVSTPAHDYDHVLRHFIGEQDPVVAGEMRRIAALDTGTAPLVIRLDPLITLCRHVGSSAEDARAWNAALASHSSAMVRSGWKRNPKGFVAARDISQMGESMLHSLLAGLRNAGRTEMGVDELVGPTVPGTLESDQPYDHLVELRRGARRAHVSAVRKYDFRYRHALLQSAE